MLRGGHHAPPPPILLGLSRPWTLDITDFGLQASPMKICPRHLQIFLFLVIELYPNSVYDGGGGTAPLVGLLSINL